MWNRLKKRIKGRKGLGSIEIVIASMIVVMIIAGLVDMIQITQRLDTSSQATGYISRVVQKQGGVQPKRVENFNGKYTTTSALYNNVKEMMEANGIKEDEWKLKLTTSGKEYTIKSGTKVPLVDYGHRIRITLEVNYRWNVLSTMFPVDFASARESNREVLSGYQIRNSKEMNTDLDVN